MICASNNLMDWAELLEGVQKACLPATWSTAVRQIREGARVEVRAETQTFLVSCVRQSVSYQVTFWQDLLDWDCDCGSDDRVCLHVAIAIILLKNNPQSVQQKKTKTLCYEFRRWNQGLKLIRHLESEQGKFEKLLALEGSLVMTQEDQALERIFKSYGFQDPSWELWSGEVGNHALWKLVFPQLAHGLKVFFEGVPVKVVTQEWFLEACLHRCPGGYLLKHQKDPRVTEIFSQGIVYYEQTLALIRIPHLTSEEQKFFNESGHFFKESESVDLFKTFLPRLGKKIKIHLPTETPTFCFYHSKIVLQLEKIKMDTALRVLPMMSRRASSQQKKVIYEINHDEEKKHIDRLQKELQLTLGQSIVLEGKAMVTFLEKAKTWELSGLNPSERKVYPAGVPQLHWSEEGLKVSFVSEAGEMDFKSVMTAWRMNQDFIPWKQDGWAQLPQDWLQRYGDRLHAFLTMQDQTDRPQEVRFQAMRLYQELQEEDRTACVVPEEFQKIFQSQPECLPAVSLPEDLTVSLRGYQKIGVHWLSFLKSHQLGGILADDMGLGKTLQAICLLSGCCLVVVPTSLLFNWSQQIEQFRPHLPYEIYYGAHRQWGALRQKFSKEKKDFVVLTTYGLLRSEGHFMNQIQWDMIFLDEAQVIKNSESQVAQAVRKLKGRFRLAMTGTPVENHLEDLWSQFDFVLPGFLGELEDFRDRFIVPIMRADQKVARRLHQHLKPFILRRLKKDVAQDLPPKTEKFLFCEFSDQEREFYEILLASTRREVLESFQKGGAVLAALEQLLRLRQLCCHPALVPGLISGPVQSSKVDLLLETLKNSIDSGHRALVFSQWTSYLDLIEKEFQSQSISFSRLDGRTRHRQEVVDAFQSPDGPSVLLISLKAGGLGLTLTAADHIFLMDPWWNPTVEDQAASRAHRIGQVNPVLIHRLIARDTIEEGILKLQQTKLALSQIIFNEGKEHDLSQSASWNQEAILSLLDWRHDEGSA